MTQVKANDASKKNHVQLCLDYRGTIGLKIVLTTKTKHA